MVHLSCQAVKARELLLNQFGAGARLHAQAYVAAQHIQQILCCQNYAPGNAGLILWVNDIALPIVLLFLAYSSRDAYERMVRTPH